MQLFSFLLYQEFFPKCCEIFGCILCTKAHYKQLLDEVFVISRIIKVEVQCRGYQPNPKAEADNPYRDLNYISGYHKNRI